MNCSYSTLFDQFVLLTGLVLHLFNVGTSYTPPRYGTRIKTSIRFSLQVRVGNRAVSSWHAPAKAPLRASDGNGADPPVCINKTRRIIQFGEQGG